jgi:hypothetical protein
VTVSTFDRGGRVGYTRNQARAAVHQSWANTQDRAERTRPAREAYRAKLEKAVDPDGKMTPRDRKKAAENQRRANLLKASQKGVKARRAKRRRGDAP